MYLQERFNEVLFSVIFLIDSFLFMIFNMKKISKFSYWVLLNIIKQTISNHILKVKCKNTHAMTHSSKKTQTMRPVH